jgi:hypothetical protein
MCTIGQLFAKRYGLPALVEFIGGLQSKDHNDRVWQTG